MNELITGHVFEILVLIGNLVVAGVTNNLKLRLKEIKQDIQIGTSSNDLKIQDLKTEMYKQFLTKDDFYSSFKNDTKHRG